MNNLTLCFSTYYHCVVKGNTTTRQNKAVSIMLCGKELNSDGVYLNDTTISLYANGKKPIPDSLLVPLLQCQEAEIAARLAQLNFQGIGYIVNALLSLIDSVTNLSASDKEALKRLVNRGDSEYDFLAAVFCNAIRCPASSICAIDEDIKNKIRDIKFTARGINRTSNQQISSDLGFDIQGQTRPQASPRLFDEKLFDQARAVNLQYAEVAYPFQYEDVEAYMLIVEPSSDAAEMSGVSHIFSYGVQDYSYLLISVMGSIDRVDQAIRNSNFFAGAKEALLTIRYAEGVNEVKIKQIQDSVNLQAGSNCITHVIARHNGKFLPSHCEVRLLCRMPKSKDQHMLRAKNYEMANRSDLPRKISLYELLQIKSIEDMNLQYCWNSSDITSSMEVPVGITNANTTLYFDLHDNVHGPNALIAGMVGSGKSEFLLTYIISIALHFSPYDVGFIIFDCKGGGQAYSVNGLPHLLGTITSLDDNFTYAISQLKDEVDRRRRLLVENNTSNIDAYTKQYREGLAATPLPHLIIIIDEFAEIKSEKPESMRELIQLCKSGGPMGIHLLLSTQKPSGVVSEDIWSIMSSIICFKVFDEHDSMDVLQSPLAFYLQAAGRGYYKFGGSEMIEKSPRQFQCAYSAEFIDNRYKTQLEYAVSYIEEYCKRTGMNKLPNIIQPQPHIMSDS